jgi:uncharacterized phosphosugar-binding protein
MDEVKQNPAECADQAQDVVAKPVQVKMATPTKVFSTSGHSYWKPIPEVKHTDVLAVIKAVIAGEFPIECVEINDAELERYFKRKEIYEYDKNGIIVTKRFKNTSR